MTGKRLGTGGLVAALAAATLSAPVRADVCTDYRRARASFEGAYEMLAKVDSGSPGERALHALLSEEHARLRGAGRAVVASVEGQAKREAFESIRAVTIATRAAREAVHVWDERHQGNEDYKSLVRSLAKVARAILQARNAAFRVVCPWG